MSNILLATVDFPPQRGGVARYLGAIKQTFQDRVQVLYWDKNVPRGVRLIWELYQASKGASAIWTSHVFPIGTAALVVHLVSKKPYVVMLHGMDLDLARRNPARTQLAKIILRQAEHVVTNSRALAKEVKTLSARDSLVVYPSISDDLFRQGVHTKKDHFHHRPVRLLTVGRLVERKGHEKVLRALESLPGIMYDIVGDGPEAQRIEQLIYDKGLHDRVRMHKKVSDSMLGNLYEQADIFVMPTTRSKHDREGFGIVYLEAAAFGLPVIATNTPGVDEAVVDKVTGLLVNDTHEALTAAIDQLAADPGRREQMGRAGRDFVKAGFTREVQMRKLEGLL